MIWNVFMTYKQLLRAKKKKKKLSQCLASYQTGKGIGIFRILQYRKFPKREPHVTLTSCSMKHEYQQLYTLCDTTLLR